MEVLDRPACSSVDLLPYQRAAVDKMVAHKGVGGLFLEMGTGKTRIALEIVRQMECKKVLVVVPLSTVGVWKREIALVRPDLRVIDATTGSIKERARLLPSPQRIANLAAENRFSAVV